MQLFNKFILLSAISFFFMAFTADKGGKTVYDFTVDDIIGNKVELSKYKGKVLLIVNVASKCGLTPQYADIQELYDEYASEGLVVLGFPANNFLGQEPGDDDQINTFCTEKFGVTFPMFSKISVKGKNMHPLYQFLTQKSENGVLNAPVQWNFQKYLIGGNGRVVASFKPGQKVSDEKVLKEIQKELKKINK